MIRTLPLSLVLILGVSCVGRAQVVIREQGQSQPRRPIADIDASAQGQSAYLTESAKWLVAEQLKIKNMRTDAKRAYFDAMDEERSAQATLARKTAQYVERAREKWDRKNFRCSEGNTWDNCMEHASEKLQWLEQGRLAVVGAESAAKGEVAKAVSAARRKATDAYLDLKEAERRQRQLEEINQKYYELNEKHENGELWLVPGSKPPIDFPKSR